MLNKALKEAGFSLASNVPNSCVHHPTFGVINFETLTVERATMLHERGYVGLSYTPKAVIPNTTNNDIKVKD